MSVILVLTDSGNRDLLRTWLEADLGHSVVGEQAIDDFSADIDLCLIDSEHILAHGEALRRRKVQDHPVFFPVILTIAGGNSPSDVASIRSQLGDLDYLVDDVLPMPVKKDLLRNRFESLLRIRDQSRDLRESEARFRALVDQSLSGVFLASNNRFEYVNQRLADMFGFARADLMGRNLDQLAAEVDQGRLAAAFEDYQAGTSRYLGGTFEGRRTDGDSLFFMLEAHRIHLDGQEVTLGTVVDISDQVRAEREASRRADELALLNQIIRHDVRNDLNVVLGWGETLAEHVDETGRPILERILNTADHMHELTMAVRDLTTILEENGELTLEPVDVVEVLRTEMETVAARYEGSREVSIRPVGEFPDQVIVQASGMLSSVFDNLLSNAIRHSDTEAAEIEVAVDTTEGSVSIAIADNGPGVPDEHKDRIFGRGEKGLGSTGSGLGLYLVDTLVQEFEGEITVSDNDPRGAVFTVTLPRS